MLRGESNLPMRETWQRRRERRELTGDDLRRMETYGLSPRGASVQRHEPINVFKVDKVGQILSDSGPAAEKVPQPPPGPMGPDSPRVKFTVHQAPESARAVMQEAAAQQSHAEAGMTKKEWKRKLLEERHIANQARMAESLKRSIEQANNRRELKFQQNLRDLVDNREFVNECYSKVEASEEAKKQKQKKLYKEWEEQVFDKIQEQVVDQVDALDIFDMEARKQKLFKDYIAAENRMQEGIKRDVVIKADYDPYQWKEHAVRYKKAQIADPVKRDLEKMYEDKLGPSDSKGTIPKHRTRVCIDPQMYDGAKLKGTPHGIFANMMDGNKNLEKSEMNKKIFKDHVGSCFNHFRPLVDHGKLASVELHDYHGTKGRRRLEPFTGEETDSEY
jgi:hypothetical protein